MYRTKEGKSWIVLVLLILAGIVLGGFLGEYLGGLKYLEWLRYGTSFGLTDPLNLDLGLIAVSFGFTIKFSICGIIGILLAILIYKNL